MKSNITRKSRRTFLKVAGMSALTYSLFGCGSSSNQENENKSTEQSYSPIVNSNPYPVMDYSIGEAMSESSGKILIKRYEPEDALLFFVYGEEGHLKDINAWAYENKNTLEKKLLLEDPNGAYFPMMTMLDSPSEVESISEQREFSGVSYGGSFYLDKIHNFVDNILVKPIKEGLPNYDFSCQKDSPGRLYLGDWSFNQVKQLNTNLKNASIILTIIPATSTLGASSYAIFSKSGMVLNYIDDALDIISSTTSYEIDKDKRYSIFYACPFIGMPELIFEESCVRNNVVDIKNLIPLEFGNEWVFKSGIYLSSARVEGTRRIAGKKLISIKYDSETRDYYGFYEDTLNYYGFYNSSIGDVLFNPPLKIGDNSITTGKSFGTTSEIIFLDSLNDSGFLSERFDFIGREDVVLLDNSPYGDCWKCNENINIQINGRTNKTTAQHWFSENLGKVKTTIDNIPFELKEANKNFEYDVDYTSSPDKMINPISNRIVKQLISK